MCWLALLRAAVGTDSWPWWSVPDPQRLSIDILLELLDDLVYDSAFEIHRLVKLQLLCLDDDAAAQYVTLPPCPNENQNRAFA